MVQWSIARLSIIVWMINYVEHAVYAWLHVFSRGLHGTCLAALIEKLDATHFCLEEFQSSFSMNAYYSLLS